MPAPDDLRQRHGQIAASLAARDTEAARALLETVPPPVLQGDINFLLLAGGLALLEADVPRAEAIFTAILDRKPGWPPALANLAQAQLLKADQLARHGNQQAANAIWEQAIAYGSRDPGIVSNLWLGRRKLWDWTHALPAFSETELTPAAATVLSDDPAFQRRVAESWAKAHLPPAAAKPERIKRKGNDSGPLRVGYLSSDIHHHATAYLIAELFALHDPARITAFCFSYGTPDASAIRKRITDSAPHFVDLHGLPQAAQLQALREAQLDILVDLKGHTRNGALSLLQQRAAPIQLHYLGHPGTIASGGIDYLVGDYTVTPPGCARHYSETLLRLPDCYQINDRARTVADTQPRSAYGLPDDKIVLACFNQSYKLTPEVFALWAEILEARPETVLWLYNNVPGAEDNLRTHAANLGIDHTRLIFAGPLPNDAHLARYQAADLILDTYPYTSHTTGSDALWAGVPLATRQGQTYASRVAASLLHAVGLRELIVETSDAYRQLIFDLIDNQPRRARLRQHLLDSCGTAPLWDTVAWIKNWEAALLSL